MPELPEVETIRADLERRIVGRQVVRAELLWPGCVAIPTAEELVRDLPGHTIERAGRRGKFLVLDLDGGAALTVHLRMTGRFRLPKKGEARPKHLHAVISLDDGHDLWFEDQRKFGRLYFTRNKDELAAVLRKLGPEPLDATFTRAALAELLAKRRAQLKPLLLNQSFVAGLGNIYVDEALFRARLHPLRRSDTLSPKQVTALHAAIVHALRQGIVNRGTTLSDYRDAWGTAGMNRERLQVFRREGKPCPRCGTPIEKIRVAQRGTHYCPSCQSPPPTT
ncbi:MAG TPA: bifunctional DNA-formamidopyrimidine glycosylase/DNA-(apurinic or apyrimidinic site) lyase [Chloroflexota bacterium]|nr:bifunctional DNA-formamidopyrimidine glycosylase/DNA-(apurinic or apyrimidinic site) lyase [Chloroflexota bacterium]